MARNMLKKGLDMSLISEISGLNIEEIQELTKTNQEQINIKRIPTLTHIIQITI